MTTTWAEFLAEVRSDLKDDGTSQKWTDAVLYVWTKDAVKDYSIHFPRFEDRVTLTASGTNYALPTDYVDDIFVECPEDRYLSRRRAQPGRRYYSRAGEPTMYFVSGSNLRLNGTTAKDVLLSYKALHTYPLNATDNTFVFTVPERDMELIRLYVKAKAMEQLRSKQAIQDRYKPGSGDRRDNPLDPETDDLMKQYEKKIADRYRGGAVMLRRDKSS